MTILGVMMNKLLAALAFSAALPASADTIGPYSDLVVFGDSLSDSGNVAFLADNFFGGFDYTSYPNGQFTDGDSWATQLGLTPSLLGGTNYAHGGARAADNGDAIPDLDAQVSAFLGDAPSLGSNALAAIWIGGNDFRDFANAGAGGGDAGAVVDFVGAVITEISDAVVTLASTDIKDIVVFGLPDLGKLPDYVGTALGEAITNAVYGYNAALQAATVSLDAWLSGNRVSFFDTNSLFLDVLGSPEDYGFSNVTAKCLSDGSECDPSEYVFWDSIHPTEGVHELFAAALTSQSLSEVPLPAGFPLLIGALGAFGLMRHRQRSLA